MGVHDADCRVAMVQATMGTTVFNGTCPIKKANEKAERRHKTSIDWTRQMVKLVSRWLKRPWILIGDGAYACMKLAQNCIKHKVTLISRLRLDAQLFESPRSNQNDGDDRL